jgi:hypothetical protein
MVYRALVRDKIYLQICIEKYFPGTDDPLGAREVRKPGAETHVVERILI